MLELLRASWLLFRLHVVTVARSKRTLIAVVLAAIPPLIAFLVMEFGPGADHVNAHGPRSAEILRVMSTFLSLQVIVPVLALIAGSAVVTEEVENRTITYLFTRPFPRLALVLGRWAATLVVVSALLGGSALALVSIVGLTSPADQELGLRFVAASLIGGAIYSLIAAILGIFLKRPMVVALGYAFAIEGVLANLPGSTQAMSVQFYLRSMVVGGGQGGPEWSFMRELLPIEYMTLGDALTRLALVAGALLVTGGWAIRRKQFVLTS